MLTIMTKIEIVARIYCIMSDCEKCGGVTISVIVGLYGGFVGAVIGIAFYEWKYELSTTIGGAIGDGIVSSLLKNLDSKITGKQRKLVNNINSENDPSSE